MLSEKFSLFRKNLPEILFIITAFLFSFWLMFASFGYDSQAGTILVGSKLWSDFGAHLPLIRSFSWGKNFPPEYPLFPGEPIRYHFLFYAFVGFLEKIGLRLDWALNLPSALGFFFLILMIYFLAKLLFQQRSIAFLSVIFFLFNGSFSFLEFFRLHPPSLQSPQEIVSNLHFPSFGPYDRKVVSAFWNWNIFTNQRHLAVAYFLPLLVIYLLLKSIKTKEKLKTHQFIIIISILGLLPYLHKAVLFMTGLVLISFFLYFPKLRRSLLIIFLISSLLVLPQIISQFSSHASSLKFNPGYLVERPLKIVKFFSYWFFNLGLSLFLIPLGFFFADKTAKKVFLSICPLFIVGNLFQFSPDIAANHKFFNLFLIVVNIYVAFALSKIWQSHFLGKLLVPFLVFFLTFSGIIDAFPIKNDPLHRINDAPKDPDILWIKENTLPDAIFLNSSYLYHPASLAGRKIFLGWPYFAWSAGYDTYQRDRDWQRILKSTHKKAICVDLANFGIGYLALNAERSEPNLEINFSFFDQNFLKVYQNPATHLVIYDVYLSCPQVHSS